MKSQPQSTWIWHQKAIGHNGRALSQSESRHIAVCLEGRRFSVIGEGHQEMEAINHMMAGSTNQLLRLPQLIMWLPLRAEPESKDAEFAPPVLFNSILQWPAARCWPHTPSLTYSGDHPTNTEPVCWAEISTGRKEVVFHSEPWRDQVGGWTYRVEVRLRHKNTNTRQFRLDRPKASFLIIPHSTWIIQPCWCSFLVLPAQPAPSLPQTSRSLNGLFSAFI